MEGLELMAGRDRTSFWKGRRVLVTGHTGFIGGWLAHALVHCGARVSGFADGVPTTPSLFDATGLGGLLADKRGEISDLESLCEIVQSERPDVVFHLAAQPLVRRAYKNPYATYRSNVLGTVAVLEALRLHPGAELAVLMTTDKVYRNREWDWAYREADQLGGHEPYGLSKAMAEMAIAQYGETYFAPSESHSETGPRLVSVRAGNVIGGGDWSEDRLIPDAVRAWQSGQHLTIRSPKATRPWQHVLDVVDALLLVGERALGAGGVNHSAYNIGPEWDASVPVADLVGILKGYWGQGAEVRIETPEWQVPEAQSLSVDSTRLRSELGWKPVLRLPEAVRWTVEWYKAFLADTASARAATTDQIKRFFDASA